MTEPCDFIKEDNHYHPLMNITKIKAKNELKQQGKTSVKKLKLAFGRKPSAGPPHIMSLYKACLILLFLNMVRLPAVVWSSSESLDFCCTYNPILKVHLVSGIKQETPFLNVLSRHNTQGQSQLDLKVMTTLMILLLPTYRICKALHADVLTFRADGECLFSLFFFFKQETTCLKTSTQPQQVCFCFLKVKNSFAQPTCLSREFTSL